MEAALGMMGWLADHSASVLFFRTNVETADGLLRLNGHLLLFSFLLAASIAFVHICYNPITAVDD